MTFRYYLRHCLWGLGSCGSLVYNILTDLNEGNIFPPYVPYMPYIAAYLTIGAVAYPFAYYALEVSAQRIMTKKSWDRHFSDLGPSRNLFLFVLMLCILFVVPFLILYFFISK
ncbi:hypothetical protein JP88_004661 [Salmonella enterica subsp. enterica]|nr:hypothetical protein [Salmonella enterica]EBY0806022.1 hypothetical protein [Salmonella enterica subsp. enterica serovar Berlin]ECF3780107.1 hypothetical protein [Salmonella enterica subsp. enterica serovar Oslo]EDR2105712.1 hypothetical protein [Salmonella enterica subsp. enterica]EDW0613203.1 hypothetical protein [Salmonella enterica subsp. enterica serovar Ball]EGZ4377647.1 hypothetical protein [Salmonella enterica subsp. enterica serovar Lexington]